MVCAARGRTCCTRRALVAAVQDVMLWMSEKSEADRARGAGAEGLWCVHGKLYDLTKFVDRHPGGPDWLKYTVGGDITELFETHHMDDKVRDVLAKYYVRDCEPAGDADKEKRRLGEGFQPFLTFHRDGLFKTLQRRIHKLLPNPEDRGPTATMRFYCWTALIAWLALFAAMATTGSFYFAVAAGVLLHTLFGIGHNTFHQADTPWRFCTDLALYSAYTWRVSHAISHHHWSNTEVDIEASLVEPYIYFLGSKPRNSVLVLIYWPIFYGLAGVIDWVGRMFRVVQGKLGMRPEFLLGPLQLVILCYFHGGWHGLGLFLTMQAVASVLMIGLSSLVHRTPYAWTSGDPDAQRDFASHLVCSTTDHTTGTSLFVSLFVFSLFNNHVLHHLFPTVDMSRLRGPVYKTFVDTCREFGAPYRCVPLWRLWKDSVSGSWRRFYYNVTDEERAGGKKPWET